MITDLFHILRQAQMFKKKPLIVRKFLLGHTEKFAEIILHRPKTHHNIIPFVSNPATAEIEKADGIFTVQKNVGQAIIAM